MQKETQTPRYKKRGATQQNIPKTNTVFIGSVELPINEIEHPYVPEKQNIIGMSEVLEAMALGVKQKKAVILKGETGTGKTTLVHELAHLTNNVIRQINLNGNMTTDEFVGRTILNRDGTEFVYGILVDAMQYGHWLLLDEINAGLPEVLLVLNDVLLTGRYTLVENGGEVIEAHENFRVFATMNPPETYIGTNHLNVATLSRFKVGIEVEYPEAKTELQIVKSKLPKKPITTDKQIKDIVRLATDVRNGYAMQEYAYILSTRDVITWVELNEHYNDLVKSAKYAILGKCNSDDRKALESIIKVYFSVSEEVTPEDGQYNMKYKEGNTMQVCDDIKLDVYTHEMNYLGKATIGTIFELTEESSGVWSGRLLKGEVVNIQNDGTKKPVPVPKTALLKLSELTMISTRLIERK